MGILIASDSDWQTMEAAARGLEQLNISYEVTVTSAHRSPLRTVRYARSAQQKGLRVLIVGAGGSAHLAGVVAAYTILPVIGVPLDSTGIGGVDAVLATLQMPAGVPVATMAIGKAGAENAAIFAAQILALQDQSIAKGLVRLKAGLAKKVEEQDRQLPRKKRPPHAG